MFSLNIYSLRTNKLEEIKEQRGGCWELEKGGRNEEMLVKGCKCPVIRWISSEDLMYNTVIVINTEKGNYVREWRHRLTLLW